MDFVDPLSGLLWLLTAFAASMYPIGFMLGGSCSNCCASDCEPLFYRCMRFLSVDGVVPTADGSIASKTIYRRRDAGIVKASASADVVATITCPANASGHLSAGETLVLKSRLTVRRGDNTIRCPNATKDLTINIIGRDFPLNFNNAEAYITVESLGTPNQNSATTDRFNAYITTSRNALQTPLTTATVVAATISGPLDRLPANLTESDVRSWLSFGSAAYVRTYGDQNNYYALPLTATIPQSIFQYVQTYSLTTVAWLVRVSRGTAISHFVYTATIAARNRIPPNLPSTFVGTPDIPALPSYPPNYDPDTAIPAPVVSGNTITFYGANSTTQSAVWTGSVALDRSSCTPCTTDTCEISGGAAAYVSGRAIEKWADSYNAVTCNVMSTTYSLDKWAVEYKMQPPAANTSGGGVSYSYTYNVDGVIDNALGVVEYDSARVQQFIDGTLTLRQRRQRRANSTGGLSIGPVSYVLEYNDVKLVEPSPLCGMWICSMPQQLLPQGITFTPKPGTKYGCKDGYPLVLGNPSGGCVYSHATNECNGVVSKQIGLWQFWKQYPLALDVYGKPSPYDQVDALSWIDYTPEPLVLTDGTYSVEGVYDSTVGVKRNCRLGNTIYGYGTSGCYPSEVSVTVGSLTFAGYTSLFGTTPPGNSVEYFTDGLNAIVPGTYVLTPMSPSRGCASTFGYAGDNGIPLFAANGGKAQAGAVALEHGKRVSAGWFSGPIFVSTPYQQCDPRNDAAYANKVYANVPYDINQVGIALAGYGLETTSLVAAGGCSSVSPDNDRVSTCPSITLVLGGREVSLDYANYANWYFTGSLSYSDGSPIPACSPSYSPSNLTIDPGQSVTFTPDAATVLCGGVSQTLGPFYNERDEPKEYKRLIDGVPQTITVRGRCRATPRSADYNLAKFGSSGPSAGFNTTPVIDPDTGDYAFLQRQYLWSGFDGTYYGVQDFGVSGGTISIPIETNGASCTWTATSKDSWLVVRNETNEADEETPANRTGTQRLCVKIAPMDFGTRVGTIEITTQGDNPRTETIKIRQGGSTTSLGQTW